MSTSATFEFENESPIGEKSVTTYVHWDSYPEGAAEYFLNMIEAEGSIHAGLGTRFIRANSRAEITESHDLIGDTEYQYDVSQDGTLVAASMSGFGDRSRDVFFEGTIREFIDEYGRDDVKVRARKVFGAMPYSLQEIDGERIGDYLPVSEEQIEEALQESNGQKSLPSSDETEDGVTNADYMVVS